MFYFSYTVPQQLVNNYSLLKNDTSYILSTNNYVDEVDEENCSTSIGWHGGWHWPEGSGLAPHT